LGSQPGDRCAGAATRHNIKQAASATLSVKRWRDGEMKKRWIAAGMLEAERSFRRLKGHADMPVLVTAITNAVNPGATATPANYAQVA
jgi:hypothetical protein